MIIMRYIYATQLRGKAKLFFVMIQNQNYIEVERKRLLLLLFLLLTFNLETNSTICCTSQNNIVKELK